MVLLLILPFTSYLLFYEDGIQCTEMLAFNLHMPVNHPEESTQYLEHAKSLQTIQMFCLQNLNDIINLIHIYKNAVKMHCSPSQHYVKNFIIYRLGSKPEKLQELNKL
jgi:hypothetical protein